MLDYKDMTSEWWAEPVSTAVYLISSSTSTADSDVIPYELGFRQKALLGHQREFESQIMLNVHIGGKEFQVLVPRLYREHQRLLDI